MSNNDTIQDLFTWEQTLRITGGNTFAADTAVSAEQAKRYVTGALQHLLAVLLIAKEQPEILDAAIAVVERALE
jgi:hypothetical protein